MQYKRLEAKEIYRERFANFIRRQPATKCWRKIEGNWEIREEPFVDDWSEKDYQTLIACLKHTAESGGFVYTALVEGAVKGFVSVEPVLFGSTHKYLDLSSIHVSQDMRRQGIGKALFCAAKEWAKEHGAEKLYISAHSAVETQSFYLSMGCRDAEEINALHAENEPCDRQMECDLSRFS